jgi:hypothetical protein
MALELYEIEVEVEGYAFRCGAYNNNSEYRAESSDLPDISLSGLVKALRLESRKRSGKRIVRIFLELDISQPEKQIWDYNILGIYLDCRSTFIDLQFLANSSIGAHPNRIEEIVESRIQGTDFQLRRIKEGDSERLVFAEDGWRSWVVDIRIPLACNASVKELLRMRADVCQEIFLPRSEITSPYLILRAIQQGRSDVLIGTAESEILDVKSTAYDLKKAADIEWKIELCQDVAQFANAHGGLLIIGYYTKKVNGLDIITKITPVQPKATRLQSYADILKSHIHPPISGLQLGSVPIGNNEVIYFYIPPQPEENKPYLVTGAFLDGCYSPAGISIVRRQGDGCVNVSAQEIHAAIVAGRAFIRSAGRRPSPFDGVGDQF